VVGVSAASEFKHAAQVLDDIALPHRMAAGTLMSRMSERPPGNLLEHRRRALPSVSVAVAAQLLGVSPTTVSFGMAVTGTIIITTLLLFYLARTQWRWSLWRVLLVGGPILALEGLFLAANLTKLVHGAWLPLLIGVAIFTVFTTWQRGRQLVTARRDAAEGPLRAFVDDLHEQRLPVQRVPDTAVFLNRGRTTAPLAMRLTSSTTTYCTNASSSSPSSPSQCLSSDPKSSRMWTIWATPTTESPMWRFGRVYATGRRPQRAGRYPR
jgi:hypothetical protein